jgi:hypothetical protein
MSTRKKTVSKLGAAALILMAGGFGWIGGNFPPAGTWPFVLIITLVHFVPVAALIALAPSLFFPRPAAWAWYGGNVVACFGLLSIVVAVGLTMANPAPDASGLHSFYDYVPTVLVFLGSMTWLVAALRQRGKPGRMGMTV